jgi:MFS family permease
MMAGLCAGAFTGMVFPFLTKIARGDLHASQNAIALMVAAPFIGNLFSPVWARQMEGKDKLPFCLYSWSIARSLLLLMPLAVTGNLFVLLITLLQIVGTVASPAYTSLMRDIYPDSARGRLMGYVRVMAQSAMFLATLITGRLMDSGISYRYLFPLAGVFGIGAALAFRHVRALPVPTVADKRHGNPITQPVPADGRNTFLYQTISILKHNHAYRYFALSVFIYGFANLMMQPLYGLYQVDILHISSTQIANLTNIGSLCAIAGAFFWGRFMDKRGAPMTVMCSIVLIAIIPIIYLFTRRVEALFVASVLSGLGFAGIELSYLASILLYAERERTAQYQSLHSLLLGIRGVIAPLLAVPLVKMFGYPVVFWGAFGVMLVGAYLQGLAVRADAKT